MKITESHFNQYVRRVLQEEVFGAQAFVYHGSNTGPLAFAEMIEQNSFAPGLNAGSMYGKGLYTVYEDDRRYPTFRGDYGDFVYKLKVNLSGFLILDSDVCVKVNGKKMSLTEQLNKLGMQKQLSKLKKMWPTTDMWTLRGIPYEHVFEEDDLNARFKYAYTSDIAHILSEYLKNLIAGLVFTGRRDGKVCLIYDPSTVVIMGWHFANSTRGKFLPVKPGKQQIYRSATFTPDPTRYAAKSKKSIAIMVKAIEENGFKVDRNKFSKLSHVGLDMNDALLGEAPPADVQWWEDSKQVLDVLMSDDGITPEPKHKDKMAILKSAFKAAFHPNTERYLDS